jgi:rubredoxin
VKILKQGEVPTDTKKFTCKKCGTVFEAEKGEYVIADQWAYMHDGITAFCDCPVCGKVCDV